MIFSNPFSKPFENITDSPELQSIFKQAGGSSIPVVSGDEFFAQSLLIGWQQDIRPAAFYDSNTNTTWIAWQNQPGGTGTAYDARCRTYNHTTKNWSPEIIMTTNGLTDDNHGSPAIIKGTDEHIYAFYGAHITSQRVVISTYPNDPISWTASNNILSNTSYPHPSLVGSNVWLMNRIESNGVQRIGQLTPLTTFNGSLSVGTPISIIDFGSDGWFYAGNSEVLDDEIHFVCARANNGNTQRNGVYYFIYNTTNGSVRNFDNSVSYNSGSLPLTLAETDATPGFRIFPLAGKWTSTPSFCFDSQGHPHVVYSFSNTENQAAEIFHIWHNGVAWQDADSIANTDETVAGFSITPGPNGTVEVWYYRDPLGAFSQGGNIYRRIWTSGSFASEQLINTPTGNSFATPMMVRNQHANARMLYRQSGTNAKGYLYGDAGPVLVSSMFSLQNTEAQNYINRLSIKPSYDEQYYIDRLFSAIKEIGIAKFDAFWLTCMGTEADSLLNILGSNFSITNNGATFAANSGFTTDGIDDFLDLNYNPATQGVAYTQDSAHFGVVHGTSNAAGGGADGRFDGTDGTTINPRNAAQDIICGVNQTNFSTVVGTFGAAGLTLMNRSSSNTTQIYRNSAAMTVGTNPNQTSVAVNSLTLRLNGASGSTFSNRLYRAAVVGGSLTANEVAILYLKGIFPLMNYKGLL